LKLEKLISKNELYINPKVSLNLLAKRLDLSSGYLSQVINKVTGGNFSEYINSYRINEVNKMLLNPEFDKYSILSLGYEAGFNSKSVFCTTFKKQTGLTPNQFKKQNRKAENADI
jgi:AraC-like DNA-binding protein